VTRVISALTDGKLGNKVVNIPYRGDMTQYSEFLDLQEAPALVPIA